MIAKDEGQLVHGVSSFLRSNHCRLPLRAPIGPWSYRKRTAERRAPLIARRTVGNEGSDFEDCGDDRDGSEVYVVNPFQLSTRLSYLDLHAVHHPAFSVENVAPRSRFAFAALLREAARDELGLPVLLRETESVDKVDASFVRQDRALFGKH